MAPDDVMKLSFIDVVGALVHVALNENRNAAFIIGIKHGFPCINICQIPREVLKTEVEDRGF